MTKPTSVDNNDARPIFEKTTQCNTYIKKPNTRGMIKNLHPVRDAFFKTTIPSTIHAHESLKIFKNTIPTHKTREKASKKSDKSYKAITKATKAIIKAIKPPIKSTLLVDEPPDKERCERCDPRNEKHKRDADERAQI
jgi:hypothetical protein